MTDLDLLTKSDLRYFARSLKTCFAGLLTINAAVIVFLVTYLD